MAATPKSNELHELPLYILYKQFETKEECVKVVLKDQDVMFYKAWETYKFKLLPNYISCVREDHLEKVMFQNKNIQTNWSYNGG